MNDLMIYIDDKMKIVKSNFRRILQQYISKADKFIPKLSTGRLILRTGQKIENNLNYKNPKNPRSVRGVIRSFLQEIESFEVMLLV